MRVDGQRHTPAALPQGKTRTGHWVGLRAGLDGCGKFPPHRDSIPGLSSPQAVAIPTTLPGPLTCVDFLQINSPTFPRYLTALCQDLQRTF